MLSSVLTNIAYKDADFSLLIRRLIGDDAEMFHSEVLLSHANLIPFMDWAHYKD